MSHFAFGRASTLALDTAGKAGRVWSVYAPSFALSLRVDEQYSGGFLEAVVFALRPCCSKRKRIPKRSFGQLDCCYFYVV